MHGPQSWEIRVVCLTWIQKCVDLAHHIRLELELLRHRSFVTEWRSWLLHHGNFCHTGKTDEGVCPKDGLLKLSGRLGSPVPVISGWDQECPGWNTAHRQEWSLFLLEQMFHNAAAMWHKEHQRCSWGLPLEPTEAAPEHPSVWTLLGSWNSDLLRVTKQIYEGKYLVVPSMFTCVQQEDFMKELQRELSRCMTRAGLWSKRGPAELPSRSQRHSQGPVEEDQALEVEHQNRWSRLSRRRTCF